MKMENTAAEQIKRKLVVKATHVMEVRLALIVAAALMMNINNVKTKDVSIIKMHLMVKVMSKK